MAIKRVRKDDVSLLSERISSVAEHEALLSFNSDDMAVHFHEWWEDHGCALWAKSYEATQSLYD